MAESAAQVLPQAAGYGVVVGIGFFFTLVMLVISQIQNKYTSYSTKGSEEFNTASRAVKPGLIAAGIVSAWTWAATLLQSATVAYTYGISGPFWYAAGATVQILAFSLLAVKTKMNAPRCHTYLEIVKVRYGTLAHVIFICFALLTNILVGSQLLLGGSAVLTSLTGMDVHACIWLIPMSVAFYVLSGGLRATLLCDYSHTIILMIGVLYYLAKAYAISPQIGSPGKMYELLQQAAAKRPVEGNQDGSYLTMKSNSALVFGVIQLCSGSGTVFLDQGYFQRAVASRPQTAVKAYILGGIAWFAIPFGFATTLGLAAVALTDSPTFPTYPRVPSSSEISAGLASAFAASALLGTSGAILLLIILFMAVTSCASAELIAVSSILTFDIFKAYIRPTASPKAILLAAHVGIVIFAIVMAVFAEIWNAASIDLGWLFLVMGLLIGSAVVPMGLTLTWKKQSKAGAISGCLVGLVAGISAWLAEAKSYYGEITLASTGANYPTLAGNLAALMTGAIVTIVVSLIKPDDFDWEITRSINSSTIEQIAQQKVEEHADSALATAVGTPNDSDDEKVHNQSPTGGQNQKVESNPNFDEKVRLSTEATSTADVEAVTIAPADAAEDDCSPKALRPAYRLAIIASIIIPFIMDFLFPIPMFLSHYVLSKNFFTGWIVVTFIWVCVSTFISCILPVWEVRGFLGELFRRMWSDFRAKMRRS